MTNFNNSYLIRTMAQSFVQIYAHLVFSTKLREPLLDAEIRPRVHGYLAQLVRGLGSPYVLVGGVEDHVHILFDMGKMHRPYEFPEHVKKESSKFIKTLGSRYRGFYWQRSYGLFSVSPTHRDDVAAYIAKQEEHHRTVTFQEELIGFLKRYGIEFDERYIWD